MSSYSQKYNVDYKVKAASVRGYQVSKDGGATWNDWCYDMFNVDDTTYVLKDSDKATELWLASPANGKVNYMLYAGKKGEIDDHGYDNNKPGLRPVVCLKSGISLKEVEDGYNIELNDEYIS